MDTAILFRPDLNTQEELTIARNSFKTVEIQRCALQDCLVVGRYSVLPYYRELEADLQIRGCRLLNTWTQHQYIASFGYYADVAEFTPRTYFELSEVPSGGGPFVVKGRTNSRKHQWSTHMFAPNRTTAINLALDLTAEDPLIRDQGIIIREFIPFKTYEIGINGQPFINEWRFFYLGRQCLSMGFYWTNSEHQGEIDADGIELANRIAQILAPKVNFFTVDIAQKEDGSWMLIEVNDGQMSGLSGNNPALLYQNLNLFLNATSFQQVQGFSPQNNGAI